WKQYTALYPLVNRLIGRRISVSGKLLDDPIVIADCTDESAPMALAYSGRGRFLAAYPTFRDGAFRIGAILITNLPPIPDEKTIEVNEDSSSDVILSGTDINGD